MIIGRSTVGYWIAVVAALTGVSIHAGPGLRAVPVLVTLVMLPGAAFSRHLRLADTGSRLSPPIAAAAGAAWLVLASEALLYLHWWKPAALIPMTLAVSTAAAAVPVYRGNHLREVNHRFRAFVAAMCSGLVALMVASIYRARYSVAELQVLQDAWMWSQNSPRTGRTSLSGLSIVQGLIVPFKNASMGTLLAARWIGLAIMLSAVATALGWSVAIAGRRHVTTAAIAMLGAAALAGFAGPSGAASVGAPFLLAAGWCLTGRNQSLWRLGASGVLLGIAAMASPQCAVTGAALLIWLSVDTWRRRTMPGGVKRSTRKLAAVTSGLCISAVGVVLATARYGLRVPFPVVELERMSLLDQGRGFLIVASLLLVALAAVLNEISRSRGPSLMLRRRQTPIVALVASCIGAVFDRSNLPRAALLPGLFFVLCISMLLSADPDSGPTPVRSRRANWGPTLPRTGVAIVASILVLVPVAVGFKDLGTGVGTNQRHRIAFVLGNTNPWDSVYDPQGATGVLRARVDRDRLGGATIAIVGSRELRTDPTLAATLISGFEPTSLPGVWRRQTKLATTF